MRVGAVEKKNAFFFPSIFPCSFSKIDAHILINTASIFAGTGLGGISRV